ncbi:hypothetical protein [Polaribacter sp.]|uniref:hypothetical protein n=1 Tax=Polaribacter sp. TaxID=1920175 RepID=UPI003F6D60B9
MKKRILKLLVLFLVVFVFGCEPEENCETKQNCFTRPDGSKECFDVPVNCIDNGFGY